MLIVSARASHSFSLVPGEHGAHTVEICWNRALVEDAGHYGHCDFADPLRFAPVNLPCDRNSQRFRRCIDVWEESKWEVAWEMPIASVKKRKETSLQKSEYFLTHWYSYNLYEVSSRLSPPLASLAGFLEAK